MFAQSRLSSYVGPQIYMKTIIALLLAASSWSHADDDMITRWWPLPPVFPIVQVFENDPEELNPFGDPESELVDLRTYSAAEAKKWLMDFGVAFPSRSAARYDAKQRTLVVRNTAPNLDLIDAVLAAEFPLHDVVMVLEDFLSRISGQSPAQITQIVSDYPSGVLGPISSIAHELESVERSIVSLGKNKPQAKAEIAQLRQKHATILEILPQSVKLTTDYLASLNKTVRTGLQSAKDQQEAAGQSATGE